MRVIVPSSFTPERQYIVEWLLRDRLGLSVEITTDATRNATHLVAGERELVIEDGLFAADEASWPLASCLPNEPLAMWGPRAHGLDVDVDPLPVLYGSDPAQADFVRITPHAIRLRCDVFGAAFCLLTRLEELLADDTAFDARGRFQAHASLAQRHGFANRPLADEYVSVLRACIERLWPGMVRARPRYRLRLSHDVDRPFQRRIGWRKSTRWAIGEALRDRQALPALRKIVSYPQPFGRVARFEPNNRFDFLMRMSERHATHSTFNFMTQPTGDPIDADYDLQHPFVRKLMQRIHARGHTLGLHPSYGHHTDAAAIREELARLRAAAAALGIHQSRWSARQHYLRWRNPATWQAYDDAGLDCDTSVGFHDAVGFRAGTAHPYRTFNLQTRKPLRLIEQPLIAMDVALLASQDPSAPINPIERVGRLADACRRVGGELSLLWHNSSVVTREAQTLYADILARCAP